MKKFFLTLIIFFVLVSQSFAQLEQTTLQQVRQMILNIVPDTLGLQAANARMDSIEALLNASVVDSGALATLNLRIDSVKTAAAEKEAAISSGTTSQYYRGDKTWQTLDKNAVGLGNVDNTSDVNKPISTATQTALNGKQAALVSGTNIRTINGSSLLGSGDISISGTLDTNIVATQYDLAVGLAALPSGSGTSNQISYWTGTKTLGSLNTSTYPSLTELSYVKGLSSGLQTQLDARLNKAFDGYPLEADIVGTDLLPVIIKLTGVNSHTTFADLPISDATQTALDSKQNALVSGTNIRTVNGNSLLGSGDLVISGGGSADSLTFATQYDLTQGLATKQNNLVSGTNIRTVNGNSLIGSGNLDLTSGSGSTHGWRYAADYGAVGDGVTDDYNALRELFLDGSFFTQYEDTIYARLEAGKTYRVSEGFWWQGDGGVGEQRVRYLHIDGQGSTIDTDTTSFVNGYLMHFAGYYNSLVADSFTAIPNNYNRGDLTIKLPASVWNGAQRGDVVWMMANSNYGGVDTEPDWVTNSVMEGELGEILYVNADTSVTLVERLNESYTSATTVIKRFFFPTVIIENLTLNAKIVEDPSTGDCNNANKRAIDLLGVKNFIIRNVTIQGFGYESINVTNSMNGVIENYTARDLSKCNFGMNYGIAVLGCQDVVITKCNIKGGRHPIDFGSTLQLPGRRLTVSNSFLSADLDLSTSSLSTHPGVRDLTVVGNVIYGSLAVRSTHNLFSNNVIVGHSGSIQIANAWNPNGAYNIISDNYIEGDLLGGIKVYTGNVGGCTGSYTITGNTIRAEVMVWIDAYVDGDAVQHITDLIIHDNDFVSSKTGTDDGNAIMIGQSAADTLIINNLSIQNNTIRNSSYGIRVYSPSSRVQINRFLVKNNNFYTNGIIDVLSPAIIDYLDVSGNTIEAAGGDALGGWVRPIWLRSGATVTTFKHTGNTYFDFGDMSGEAFVQAAAGIVTNWYYGGDIFIGTTSFSEYGVTATNSFTIDWTP